MNDDRPFEQVLAELEAVVRRLEDGSTSLDEALAGYESGVALVKQCYERLKSAEARILKIDGVDDDGRPVTRPFEHSAAVSLGEGRRPRRPRGDDDGGN